MELPKFLDKARNVLRIRHYSLRTACQNVR